MNNIIYESIIQELEQKFQGKTFLTVEDLCAVFECDEKTVYNWNLRKNKPPMMRIGRLAKYPKEAMAQWMATELYSKGA